MFAVSAEQGKAGVYRLGFRLCRADGVRHDLLLDRRRAGACVDQAVIQITLPRRDVRKASKEYGSTRLLLLPRLSSFCHRDRAFAFSKVNPSSWNRRLPRRIDFPWFIVNELPSGSKGW